MKKVVLSVVAALAVTAAAPAFAADMPVKAKMMAPAPAPSPFDIAFGTAFTTDYMLRGISQTDHRAAVQGYFEGDYTATPWLTLYAGVWGSNIAFGEGEFDISGGARLSYDRFGLDLGYVYYAYPNSNGASYGEFYAKPSVKLTDWLTVGGQVVGGSDFGGGGNDAWYYEGNAAVTLPQFMPMGITTTVSGAVGRQTYASAIGNKDYTTWNAGIAFGYKAMTLDLRYSDTNVDSTSATQCGSTSAPTIDLCKGTFFATLKFDTTFSSLK